MKIIAHINTDTPEGRKIIEELKKYPDVVSFEGNHANDSKTLYETCKETEDSAPEGYVTLEEFRIEAKKRARKLLNEHGIYK